MCTIRALDNSEIHLECLPSCFDRLRIGINTVFKYPYVREILQHFLK